MTDDTAVTWVELLCRFLAVRDQEPDRLDEAAIAAEAAGENDVVELLQLFATWHDLLHGDYAPNADYIKACGLIAQAFGDQCESLVKRLEPGLLTTLVQRFVTYYNHWGSVAVGLYRRLGKIGGNRPRVDSLPRSPKKSVKNQSEAPGRRNKKAAILLLYHDQKTWCVELTHRMEPDSRMLALKQGLLASAKATQLSLLLGAEACAAYYLGVCGNAAARMGNWSDAKAAFRSALHHHHYLTKQGDPAFLLHQARGLSSLGLVFTHTRELRKAESAMRHALRILPGPAAEETAYRAQVYERGALRGNLGQLLLNLGRPEDATDAYRLAREDFRNLVAQAPEVIRYRAASARAACGLALSLAQLDDRKAEPIANEAIEELTFLGAESDPEYAKLLAGTHLSRALILYGTERIDEGEEAFDQALAIYRELLAQDPVDPARAWEVAKTLCYRIDVLWEHNLHQETTEAIAEALPLVERLAELQPSFYAIPMGKLLGYRADWHMLHAEFAEAEVAYRQGLEWVERGGVPEAKQRLHFQIGQLLVKEGRFEEGAEFLGKAVREVESLRAKTLLSKQRRALLRQNAELYDWLVLCLMRLKRPQDALEVAEQARNRSLVELVGTRAPRSGLVPPDILRKYDRTLARVRSLQVRMERLTDQPFSTQSGGPGGLSAVQTTPEERFRLIQDLSETSLRLTTLENLIRQYDRAFLPPDRLTAANISRLARELSTTFVIFRVTIAATFVFLVYPDGALEVLEVTRFTSPILRAFVMDNVFGTPVDGWAFHYYRNQFAKQSGDQLARFETARAWREFMGPSLRRLDRLLLRSVRMALRERGPNHGVVPIQPDGIPSLVMIPHAGLSVLPLHACWWKEGKKRRHWVDDYAIRYAASVAQFSRCAGNDRQDGPPRELFAIVNPIPPGDLVFSEWECEAARDLVGPTQSTLLIGPKATKDAVTRRLESECLIHFACHAEYRLDNRLESGLSLADGQRLTLGEVLEHMRFSQSWLVFLSACETGLIDFREIAEEHFGISLGFLYAGTPTVYATLWAVNDFPTALLTREVYRNLMMGLSKSEALRRAQVWLRDLPVREALELVKPRLEALQKAGLSWRFLEDARNRLERQADQHPFPFQSPYWWAGFQCSGV